MSSQVDGLASVHGQVFEAVLEHAPFGIWVLGPRNRLLYVSNEFCRITGILKESYLRAVHYTHVMEPFLGKRFVASDVACWHSKTGILSTYEQIGERRIKMVRIRLDSESGILGIGIDESEREVCKKQINKLTELSGMNLFNAEIAHDIRNHLTVAIAQASMIDLDITHTPESSDKMNKLILACTSAADLCQKLMVSDVSVRDEKIHVVKELASVMGRIRCLAPRVDLSMVNDAGRFCVAGQRISFLQIFMNILKNAIEAVSSTLSPSVKVFVSNVADFVEIKVKDNGCGMSSEVVAHIFEPFYSSGKKDGNGLGMAGVYQTVENFGGSIDVESVEGLGTTVTVNLPMMIDPEDEI